MYANMASAKNNYAVSSKRNKNHENPVDINNLYEMFGKKIELEAITCIAESCDWKIESIIDILFNISSPVNADFNCDWNHGNSKQLDSTLEEACADLKNLKVKYRSNDDNDSESDDDTDVVIEDDNNVKYMISFKEQDPINIYQPFGQDNLDQLMNRFLEVDIPRLHLLPDHAKPIVSDIQAGQRVLVLMRGVPGSGKSYLARALVEHSVGLEYEKECIFSADDYLAKINNGHYKFDSSKLCDAHTDTQCQVAKACQQGISPVIVDNTNTQCWEMKNYVITAAKYGYKVLTLEPKTYWSKHPRELSHRNIHNVPQEKIRAMLDRYENNISGNYLLRLFRIRYPYHLNPPQNRNYPPLSVGQSFTLVPVATTKITGGKMISDSLMQNKVPVEDISNTEDGLNSGSNNDSPESFVVAQKNGSSNSSSGSTSEVDISQFEFCDNKQLGKSEEEEIRETSLTNISASAESPERNISENINVVEALLEASLDTEQTEAKVDEDSESSNEKNENVQINVYSDEEFFETLKKSSEINSANFTNWSDSIFKSNGSFITMPQCQPDILKKETKDIETCTVEDDFNLVNFRNSIEYKILNTYNRDINETNSSSLQSIELSKVPNRFTLDKGAQTDLGDEDKSDYLLEMFNHLPKACVLDTYENLYNRDFDLTVECLVNLTDDDVTLYKNLAKQRAVEPTNAALKDTSEPNSPLRKFKKKNTSKPAVATPDEIQQLQMELQKKFVLAESSYPEYTKSVIKMKNRAKNQILADETHKAVEKVLQEVLQEKQKAEEVVDGSDDSPEVPESQEEVVDLWLGYDVIRELERTFGNSVDVQSPNELVPVIRMKKSMAQELHSLWMESIKQQRWHAQEDLDQMISADGKLAKTLEKEEPVSLEKDNSEEFITKEMMEMRLSLALCNDDSNGVESQELQRRIARQTLEDMFPECDRDMLRSIFEVHNNNFDETVRVIKDNCSVASTTTMAEVLKKRQNLFDEIQNRESNFNEDQVGSDEEGLDEAAGGYDPGDEQDYPMTYEAAMAVVSEARLSAQRQNDLRIQNNQKANEAYRSKRPGVAFYYAELAKRHLRYMEVHRDRALAAYVTAQCLSQESDTLDLHNFKVKEALGLLNIFLDQHLEKMNKGEEKTFYIITGRGARSPKGRSRLKPAVAIQLNKRHFLYEEINPGMLKVVLQQK